MTPLEVAAWLLIVAVYLALVWRLFSGLGSGEE
jgi:hypothetical protein